MKKFTEEQMANFKMAMERINAINSVEVFEDAKSGAKIAKDHMLKTIKYLIDAKDIREINTILLDYGLTESDIDNPIKVLDAVKELDTYQLNLMEEHLNMENENIANFFNYIKKLTAEFEAELEASIISVA